MSHMNNKRVNLEFSSQIVFSISLILYLRKMMHVMLSCFSRVWFCATPWTAAHQAPLSTGLSRQESGVDCHFLQQRIFPSDPGIEPRSLSLQADSLPSETYTVLYVNYISAKLEENNSGITIIRNLAAEYFLNINDYFNLLIFGVICYAPIVTRTI